jgi:hypothetical protein
VAEELRGDERRRNRTTVDGDEGASGASGSPVNGASDELFARSGLAGKVSGHEKGAFRI